MKESLANPKLMVEIDVIEVEKGEDRRIGTRSGKVVSQVGKMKLR
jgi:hypothetical protein